MLTQSQQICLLGKFAITREVFSPNTEYTIIVNNHKGFAGSIRKIKGQYIYELAFNGLYVASAASYFATKKECKQGLALELLIVAGYREPTTAQIRLLCQQL